MTDLDTLETPAVVVDRAALERNLERVQAIADRHGVALRPHAKTHKCAEIAALQRDRGAVGLTCAKVGEALFWLEQGVRSLTIAYPLIVPGKVETALAAALEHAAELLLTVDSELGLTVIDRAAKALDTRVGVFLEVDVGFGRCGLRPEDPRLVALGAEICGRDALRFAGLLSHAGQAYAAANADEARRIAEDERRTMVAVRRDLEARGLEVPAVSVGSTPTVLACADFTGITEIRPGNYVFMDRTPLRLGLADEEALALYVIATVVSRNDDYLIVDAGSKVLSSDGGGHGLSAADGFGLVTPLTGPGRESPGVIGKLSEEHGWIPRGGPDRALDLALGSRVRILPNHSCVVTNLTDELVVAVGDRVVERWRVGARGRVR